MLIWRGCLSGSKERGACKFGDKNPRDVHIKTEGCSLAVVPAVVPYIKQNSRNSHQQRGGGGAWTTLFHYRWTKRNNMLRVLIILSPGISSGELWSGKMPSMATLLLIVMLLVVSTYTNCIRRWNYYHHFRSNSANLNILAMAISLPLVMFLVVKCATGLVHYRKRNTCITIRCQVRF